MDARQSQNLTLRSVSWGRRAQATTRRTPSTPGVSDFQLLSDLRMLAGEVAELLDDIKRNFPPGASPAHQHIGVFRPVFFSGFRIGLQSVAVAVPRFARALRVVAEKMPGFLGRRVGPRCERRRRKHGLDDLRPDRQRYRRRQSGLCRLSRRLTHAAPGAQARQTDRVRVVAVFGQGIDPHRTCPPNECSWRRGCGCRCPWLPPVLALSSHASCHGQAPHPVIRTDDRGTVSIGRDMRALLSTGSGGSGKGITYRSDATI